MSGTALGFQCDRMDVDTLDKVVRIAKGAIKDVLGVSMTNRVDSILYFEDKQSFGDADILVKMSAADWDRLIKELGNRFYYTNENGPVFSVGIPLDNKRYQVDLIYSGDNIVDHWVAYDYYNYNDLGNLIGRLAHRLGFKYGHDGLRWIIRDSQHDTKVICDMTISKETGLIYKFLDLNYNRMVKGFQTREEIFEFVTSSKYFHPSIFLLENRNATSRRRDAKRETYNKFLEWCAEREFPDAQYWNNDQTQALRKVKLFEALDYFNKTDEYLVEINKYNKIELSKLLFNGDLVREWTGLEDIELGAFMKHLKTNCDMDNHELNVSHGPERIEKFVKTVYDEYKGNKDE